MMDICEAKFPDDTSRVDMEEGLSDIKYDNNEKNDGKKMQNAMMTLLLLIWRKV